MHTVYTGTHLKLRAAHSFLGESVSSRRTSIRVTCAVGVEETVPTATCSVHVASLNHSKRRNAKGKKKKEKKPHEIIPYSR